MIDPRNFSLKTTDSGFLVYPDLSAIVLNFPEEIYAPGQLFDASSQFTGKGSSSGDWNIWLNILELWPARHYAVFDSRIRKLCWISIKYAEFSVNLADLSQTNTGKTRPKL